MTWYRRQPVSAGLQAIRRADDETFIRAARERNENAIRNTATGRWLQEALRRLAGKRRWKDSYQKALGIDAKGVPHD